LLVLGQQKGQFVNLVHDVGEQVLSHPGKVRPYLILNTVVYLSDVTYQGAIS